METLFSSHKDEDYRSARKIDSDSMVRFRNLSRFRVNGSMTSYFKAKVYGVHSTPTTSRQFERRHVVLSREQVHSGDRSARYDNDIRQSIRERESEKPVRLYVDRSKIDLRSWRVGTSDNLLWDSIYLECFAIWELSRVSFPRFID